MLELAKECSNIEVFSHVSTCYVNCNMDGYIEEKVYNTDMEVEQIVSNIMKMDIQYVKENEKKIIGEFPNTYTYTKNLAEK